MDNKTPFTFPRRSFLAAAGAFGAATVALPGMAISADKKVLTVRSYSDLQILDPAFWVSIPEGYHSVDFCPLGRC